MRLASALRVSYALFEDLFGFLDKLAMQVDRVAIYSAHGIVLPKDEIGGLLVVLLHHCAMALAFFRELVGAGAIATLVSFVCL